MRERSRELTHYGVKGMKWNIRKKLDESEKEKLDNLNTPKTSLSDMAAKATKHDMTGRKNKRKFQYKKLISEGRKWVNRYIDMFP